MGKSAPAAPDYTAAAEKQGQASKELTTQQTYANRPNITTPWGSQTWSSTPGTDATTGTPIANWSSSISLSPQQQAALDSQMRVTTGRSQGAEALLNNALAGFGVNSPPATTPGMAPNGIGPGAPGSATPGPSATGIDYSGIPQGAQALSPKSIQMGLTSSAGDWRQKAQDAVDQLQAPALAKQRELMSSRLANQGITTGSEAWKDEMMAQSDAETRARLQAIASGRDEANMLFGQDLQSAQFANQAQGQDFNQQTAGGQYSQLNRQQAIAEMLQKRSQPLNELNALLTGQQVGMPQMPSFQTSLKAETPNYMGAAQNQYSAALDATNASNAGIAGLGSGLFSLGSAAMPYFAFSDKRLKRDIGYLFTLPNGIKIYKYRFIGKDTMEIGVIAQEVMEIMPDAVHMDSSGFYKVNYEMVLA